MTANAHQVRWEEPLPSMFVGYVDNVPSYLVMEYNEPVIEDGFYAHAFVKRTDAKNGARCTHVGRAKELAELQEEVPAVQLAKYGLLLAYQ